MLKKNKSIIPLLFTSALSLLILNSCLAPSNTQESKEVTAKILNTTVSVNYAPDGRLWRITPTRQAVYVDSSSDNGETYSKPIKINKSNQKTSAWPENPPAIAVSSSGRINVLFYADEDQKSTSFFSYSDDNGQTFSTPTLISNQAQSAMHYMDKMLVDKDDNLHLFWHDTRHESHDKKLG
ncbi:MAG: hypothetical protein GQ475_08110, partial [Methylococcaceae bacterium]|nr:hypothetical protein [Methylococcaceae bacterium]